MSNVHLYSSNHLTAYLSHLSQCPIAATHSNGNKVLNVATNQTWHQQAYSFGIVKPTYSFECQAMFSNHTNFNDKPRLDYSSLLIVFIFGNGVYLSWFTIQTHFESFAR